MFKVNGAIRESFGASRADVVLVSLFYDRSTKKPHVIAQADQHPNQNGQSDIHPDPSAGRQCPAAIRTQQVRLAKMRLVMTAKTALALALIALPALVETAQAHHSFAMFDPGH